MEHVPGIPGDSMKMSSMILSTLSLFLILVPAITSDKSWSSRVVTTKLGLTRGFIFIPRGYEGVEIFLGLPYASPPVGSLRLMPPVSGSPWSGTKMNEHPPPVCPQVFPFNNNNERSDREMGDSDEDLSISSGGSGGSGGGGGKVNETEILKSINRGRLSQLKRLAPFLRNQSEDCLYLNIYVPQSVGEGKTEELLPVLVFIHGDDNSYGAGTPYDPSMLVSQGNLIVITFNFRLGILGFLNANSDGYFKSPANFALLDQVAALHWVQENIGAFGGDNGNVTLMGHGKGAIFVNFLMISNAVPASEPLFHRVILMSGSALSPFTVGLSYGKDLAKKFAGRFKCPTEPPSNMLTCLRDLPIQYFIESDLWKYFGPSDDGVVIESGIRENILRDRISRFPMIFGVTKAEFLPTLNEHDAVYGLETEKRREVLKLFIDGFYSTYRSEILAAAIHEYTDWERPVQHPISVRDETLDALADAQIVAPMVKVGELHSQGNSRTYFYVFEYQSKTSEYVQRLGCVPGEDDLAYVFGVPLYLSSANIEHQDVQLAVDWDSVNSQTTNNPHHSLHPTPALGIFQGNFTRNEVQLSMALVHHWANFIKTGNPNAENQASSSSSLGEGSGLGFSVGGGIGVENRFSHQDKSSSSSLSSKLKLIEWPPYDSLLKKYLSIEAKPRIRSHYRAHKLSFWLHLVPELMRTGGPSGISSGQGQGYPNIINSNHSNIQHPPSIQLVGPPYWEQHPFYYSGNYSSYPGGDISGALGSRPNHRYPHDHPSDGYQIYSTALSVTIAVGCSLLILNILVFAAFYYFRDKRRTACHSSVSSSNPHQHPEMPDPSNSFSPVDLQHLQNINMNMSTSSLSAAPHQQLNLTTGGGEFPPIYNSAPGPDSQSQPSIHNTPIRKENGQVPNLVQQATLPMPNICGELPSLQQLISDSSRNPYHQQQHQHQGGQNVMSSYNSGPNNSNMNANTSKPPGRGQGQTRSSSSGFELSMPDAILAAAMMLNYRQNSQQDFLLRSTSSTSSNSGPHNKCGSGSSSGEKRPLNMKEQLLLSAVGASGGGGRAGVVLGNLPRSSTGSPGGGGVGNVIQFDFEGSASRTVPRPPKRNQPTVKFSPDTFIGHDGSICTNVNSSGGTVTTSSVISNTPTIPPIIMDDAEMNVVTAAALLAHQQQQQQQHFTNPQHSQLKSSLKKHSNYSNANKDELNV